MTTTRSMKAWRCRVVWSDNADGDVIYAETAGKARYKLCLTIGDVCEIKFADITAHRAPALDIVLPAEHDMVAKLSNEDRHRILHAYGFNARRNTPEHWGYRDHYCTEPACPIMARLTSFDIFQGPFGADKTGETPGWCGAFWYLTDLGKLVARSMIPAYGEEAKGAPPLAAKGGREQGEPRGQIAAAPARPGRSAPSAREAKQ